MKSRTNWPSLLKGMKMIFHTSMLGTPFVAKMFNSSYKILLYCFIVVGVGIVPWRDKQRMPGEYTPRMFFPSRVTQGVKVMLASRHMYQAAVFWKMH